MERTEMIEMAAKILNISNEKAEQYNKAMSEDDTIISFWNPIRGGGRVIIDQKTGEFLYALSIIRLSEHVEAFMGGKRTDPSFLEKTDNPSTSELKVLGNIDITENGYITGFMKT